MRRVSAWRGREENRGKGTENKKHKLEVQTRRREVKNCIGNEEGKEHICMTHRHELRWGNDGRRGGIGERGVKRRKQGTTVIA